jgi:hypothetical protein
LELLSDDLLSEDLLSDGLAADADESPPLLDFELASDDDFFA